MAGLPTAARLSGGQALPCCNEGRVLPTGRTSASLRCGCACAALFAGAAGHHASRQDLTSMIKRPKRAQCGAGVLIAHRASCRHLLCGHLCSFSVGPMLASRPDPWPHLSVCQATGSLNKLLPYRSHLASNSCPVRAAGPVFFTGKAASLIETWLPSPPQSWGVPPADTHLLFHQYRCRPAR